MWQCPNCNRIFQRKEQPHSCKRVSIEEHFYNKELAKDLFDKLFETVEKEIGECEIISLPCCVHLFGKYDFLAALPKKDRLEIRFALNRVLGSPRLAQAAPLSQNSYKNCIDLKTTEDIDEELISWIKESYFLK